MADSPVIDPTPSLLSRLNLAVRTWLYKIMIVVGLKALRTFAPALSKKYSPTYLKRYPVRPMLESRVFIPRAYTAGTRLPLYIDIHGGGFFGCDSQLDDKLCHYICNQFNYVVVSIEYRLAPLYPFPIPVDDCTELVLAVLEDSNLPVDLNKVAMGGQSAGGNLTLAVAQDPRLQSKFKALVPIYPSTDFSRRFVGDFRDKPADANGKGAQTDVLRAIRPLAQWAYVPYGHDRTDSRLSPVYADPKSLPSRIYFIAARYDKLCQEAFMMARRLAASDTVKEEDNWDINGIRWERLPNEVHGFVEAEWQAEMSGKARLPWKTEIEDVLGRVGQWLEEAFKEV